MSTSPLPFTTKSHVELHDKSGACLHKSPKRKYVHTSHCVDLHHLHALLRSLHAPELAEIGVIAPPDESVCTYLFLDDEGDWVQLTMNDFTHATSSPLRLKLVLRPKLDRVTPRQDDAPVPRRVKRRQSLPLPAASIPEMNAILTSLPLPIDAILVPNRALTSLAFADISRTLYWLDELHGTLGSVDVTSGAVRVLQSSLRRPRQLHLGTTHGALRLYFLQGDGDLCVCDATGVVCLVQCTVPHGGFCLTPNLESLLFLEPALDDATYHVVSYTHYATRTADDNIDESDARCVLFNVDAPTLTATPSALCMTATGTLCLAWATTQFVTVCRPSDETSTSAEPWDFASVSQHHVRLIAPCTAIAYHAPSETFLLGLAESESGGLARLILPPDHAPPTLHVELERALPVLALTLSGRGEVFYCVRRQGHQHDTLTWHLLSACIRDDETTVPPSTTPPTPPTPESTPKRVHIKVVVRCRPLLVHEEAAGQRSVVACDGNRVYVEPIHAYQKPRAFNFDKVFGPSTTQEDLFATSIRPIVQHAMNGYTCTVFAYGQTGSGKTHSMQGRRGADAGLMYRAIDTVFASPCIRSVRLSYVEIYNEEILDLLAASLRRQSDGPHSASRPSKLHIVKHALHGVRVHGLQEVSVTSAADAYELLELAIHRSHAIFTLYTDTTRAYFAVFCSIRIHILRLVVEDGQSIQASGQLRLVDLSGSENYERAGCLKDRQVEAANIGQGLLALGRVIKALVEGWKHVPYRESKLTRLLEDSIGGSAVTTLLLAVAPGSAAVDETLSTLSYAQMAQRVVNQPTRVHALLQPPRTHQPIEPMVVVATPWVGHVPIKTSPPRLTKPADDRVLHATTEEWSANLLVHKARANPMLSRRTIGTLQKIFDTYDAKANGVLSRFEVRRVYKELLGRPKESAPKTLAFPEFVAIFQTLLHTEPQIAQDIITAHGYTLNLEVAPLPAGVRCLRQLQQLRPASAPASRGLHRKTT
ncbi:hypothetical protein SPRG_19884 [Saprolegnia parasitica CBS 223.65]|uniref:Kinesin motor domain-containing protein n=1 Tax=Saprolegnia parasitica (strain CBS 223.65) TaxID=695850 RepID=A0A067CRT2_SAPPC|nr:hypothetical protein SPRG_19884 [Saprolegnia parasitica CBS 223.65]KDO29211.1 hypothetical protein SPRG_19884 [Saprolegnia parasitica CBS 223.65]|eukprot:XP_012200111.1 hypothetical protein SPRG_19884 [Saprolegnia parasitica CBS 223.65]